MNYLWKIERKKQIESAESARNAYWKQSKDLPRPSYNQLSTSASKYRHTHAEVAQVTSTGNDAASFLDGEQCAKACARLLWNMNAHLNCHNLTRGSAGGATAGASSTALTSTVLSNPPITMQLSDSGM